MKFSLVRFDIAKSTFVASIALALFFVGGIFGSKEWQPYQFVEDGFLDAMQMLDELRQERPALMQEIHYEGEGVTRLESTKVFNGLTLVQGVFQEGVELRLIDISGHVVHRWKADFFKIWPDPVHVFPEHNIPAGPFNYHTQGMWLLPDGSVVFNVAEKGTVKLGRCEEIEWTIDRMTHHSVTYNPDGTYWIPVKGDVRDVPKELYLDGVSQTGLMGSAGIYEDRLLLVGSDGQELREISLLRALFEWGYQQDLYDMGEFSMFDPTHMNDIEVVSSALAKKLEGVSEGDLLVSIRQLHMLAILDKESGRVLWSQRGPWVRQHDPDIAEDGSIEVFSNGIESKGLGGVPGSSIISMDPATGESKVVYPWGGQDGFFTDIMGTHQLLPNGNRLITESRRGRVFEVSMEGEIVWEYIVPYDDTHSALIEGAIRYEESYFTVDEWSCQ